MIDLTETSVKDNEVSTSREVKKETVNEVERVKKGEPTNRRSRGAARKKICYSSKKSKVNSNHSSADLGLITSTDSKRIVKEKENTVHFDEEEEEEEDNFEWTEGTLRKLKR